MLTQKAQDAIIRIHLLVQREACQGMPEDEALTRAADALCDLYAVETDPLQERVQETQGTLEDALHDFMLQLDDLREDVRRGAGPEVDFLRLLNDFDMLIRYIHEYDYALCDVLDAASTDEDIPLAAISETAGQAQFIAAAVAAEHQLKTIKSDIDDAHLAVARREPIDGANISKLRIAMSHIGQALGTYEDLCARSND